ncbi:3-hexulose-6-phosphate synthase [Aquibacillus sediminis]|uniref:3-hexulose-6-phosphate synthase n=1 Tax=Aquibacillus sediminis TaxID=2574734 RepID=UPI001108F73E|nr:3-hexulose-6-phosphate synthase [Aquibacillus sediminis]
MQLQLALDRMTRKSCIEIVNDTKESIDIIEVGTGVIKEYGMAIVRELRELYPEKTILADMKTCDAGKHEAIQAFDAGADIVTVMAFSNDSTITDTLKVAEEYGKHIMVDLLEVDSRDRIEQLQEIGVDFVSLHVGKDKQSEGQFSTDLFSLVKGYRFETSVAGGVNLDTLPGIAKENPDIVIVGSAITKAKAPNNVAAKMKQIIDS